jgi:hypothetical protein
MNNIIFFSIILGFFFYSFIVIGLYDYYERKRSISASAGRVSMRGFTESTCCNSRLKQLKNYLYKVSTRNIFLKLKSILSKNHSGT